MTSDVKPWAIKPLFIKSTVRFVLVGVLLVFFEDGLDLLNREKLHGKNIKQPIY